MSPIPASPSALRASSGETSSGTPRPPVPKVRAPQLGLDAPLPRYWFADNVLATHIANGMNLLFPAGERFFVRSVHHYLPQIEDPELRARIKAFFGQEGRHSREHERATDLVEAQGFEVRAYLRFYEKLAYGLIEKLAPPELRLAATAAAEHYTAILAEDALRRRVLDDAHPSMRALLLWHAAEEIEHRSVAFDVLAAVHPSYGLRVAGLGIATAGLMGFWALATLSLAAQDREAGPGRWWRDWRRARERQHGRSPVSRGLREYLRRDFHPSQSDVDSLAAEYLASAGLS